MPLTGQAKIDYQRDYMRKRRSNQRSNVTHESVRPDVTPVVRPGDEPITKLFREECIKCEHLGGDENDRAVCAAVVCKLTKPEPQSHNPMMVGYVPPTD